MIEGMRGKQTPVPKGSPAACPGVRPSGLQSLSHRLAQLWVRRGPWSSFTTVSKVSTALEGSCWSCCGWGPRCTLAVDRCSLHSSCPPFSGPGRSGALGKLLVLRARISLAQYPVIDQREGSDSVQGRTLWKGTLKALGEEVSGAD